MPSQDTASQPRYSIGACARMTGLSRHTLRKWEDRYHAVAPTRTEGGTRRYTGEEIMRLRLLRELVDAGHAIGAIAGLAVAELRAMTGEGAAKPAATAPLRAVAIGDTIPDELATHAGHMPAISLTASASSVDEMVGEHGSVAGDIVLVEMPSLTRESGKQIERFRRRIGIDHVVVVYAFGPLSIVERLSDERTAMVRMPLVYAELERVIRAMSLARASASGADADIPPHRVARHELARVARMASAVACECPRHTAELVMMLSRFEDYGLQCEQQYPEDAAVHHRLRRQSALARSTMEQALIELARSEGIALTMLPSESGSR